MRPTSRIALVGAAQVAVSFGFARYGYGVFLPEIGRTFDLVLPVLGAISGAMYAGYMVGVVASGLVTVRRGGRIPVLVGGAAGALGLAVAASAPDSVVLAIGLVIAGTSAGWVWTPYSDVVRDVDEEDSARRRALAMIPTGTSFGLIVLALCLLLRGDVTWQAIYAGFAVAIVAVALLNLWVLPRPRSGSHGRPLGAALRSALQPRMRLPVVFGVLSVAASAVYFTYATSLAPPPLAAALVYLVLGVSGALALVTHRLVARIGLIGAAVAGLFATAVGIAVLALGDHRLLLVVVSAVVFGVGDRATSAVLSLWTRRVMPDEPAAGLTVAVLCSGLGATALLPVVGWLGSVTSLSTALLVVGAVIALGSVAMLAGRAPAAATEPV